MIMRVDAVQFSYYVKLNNNDKALSYLIYSRSNYVLIFNIIDEGQLVLCL